MVVHVLYLCRMWFVMCWCDLFFFKQKTAYEMRISDWSSDVCSSDLFRFSAMGDVAMSAAVLRELCQRHPDIQIIMVSRPLFEPLFENIKNIHFHPLRSEERRVGKECVKYV